MSRLISRATGVFTVPGPIACVNREDVARIRAEAPLTPLRRCRICAHADNDDPVQEMIIALCHDSYIPPHRHRGKSESFHVVEGRADLFFFDEKGTILQTLSLSADSPDGFYYRLSEPLYHTVLAHDDMLVIHETVTGPFCPESTDTAPFAPSPDDAEAVGRFMAALRSVRA